MLRILEDIIGGFGFSVHQDKFSNEFSPPSGIGSYVRTSAYLVTQRLATKFPESLLQRKESHDGSQPGFVKVALASYAGRFIFHAWFSGGAGHTEFVSVAANSPKKYPRTKSSLLVAVVVVEKRSYRLDVAAQHTFPISTHAACRWMLLRLCLQSIKTKYSILRSVVSRTFDSGEPHPPPLPPHPSGSRKGPEMCYGRSWLACGTPWHSRESGKLYRTVALLTIRSLY